MYTLTEHPIKMVEIETYTRCNRRCSYCPNHDHARPDVHMPDELYHRILDQLVEIGFRGRLSYHFYNEPLLDPRLPGFVAAARRRLPECRIVLYSNGDFMTKEVFVKLVDSGMDLAWVTNHGRSAKHCAWRHELAPELAERLRYQTNQNPDIFWTNRGGLLPQIASVREPLRAVCTAIATTLVVTAEGNVVLCYEDYEGRETLGNLHRDTIASVWNSERATFLRGRLLEGDRSCCGPCQNCNNVEMQTLDIID